MRTKHERTLKSIFARPTPANIRWADIESLLRAMGVETEERAGSRVGLTWGDQAIVIHKPHPQPELPKGTVRTLAQFLNAIGVTP